MTKYLLISFLFFSVTAALSQPVKDIPKALTGTWKIRKMDITTEGKTTQEIIKDSSFYTFHSDHTYTLSCKDIWGNANIIGKWEQTGEKVKLFDITHISAHKGKLPGKIPEYYVELRTINDQVILIFSSYDDKLKWLHELYYEKNKS